MIIFADTGGWAAFFNRRDQHHDRAVTAIRAIVGKAVTFVISDYIFDETVTLLRMKSGHAQAVRCGRWLLESPLVRQLRVSEDIRRQAWDLFRQYDDQAFSFADCVSFVVMRQHKLREVFGFDRHFESMGFRLWPENRK